MSESYIQIIRERRELERRIISSGSFIDSIAIDESAFPFPGGVDTQLLELLRMDRNSEARSVVDIRKDKEIGPLQYMFVVEEGPCKGLGPYSLFFTKRGRDFLIVVRPHDEENGPEQEVLIDGAFIKDYSRYWKADSIGGDKLIEADRFLGRCEEMSYDERTSSVVKINEKLSPYATEFVRRDYHLMCSGEVVDIFAQQNIKLGFEASKKIFSLVARLADGESKIATFKRMCGAFGWTSGLTWN